MEKQVKRIKRVINNHFHGTECTVIAELWPCGAVITKKQASIAKVKTCGVKDCACKLSLEQINENEFIVI